MGSGGSSEEACDTAHEVPPPAKSLRVAFFLWFFLAPLSAHNFYLSRNWRGFAFILLFSVTFMTYFWDVVRVMGSSNVADTWEEPLNFLRVIWVPIFWIGEGIFLPNAVARYNIFALLRHSRATMFKDFQNR